MVIKAIKAITTNPHLSNPCSVRVFQSVFCAYFQEFKVVFFKKKGKNHAHEKYCISTTVDMQELRILPSSDMCFPLCSSGNNVINFPYAVFSFS